MAELRGVLADSSRPRKQRAEALRFLTHFIVDIHQPLHVGRASDRGGNSVNVWFRSQPSNLHRLWDSDAIELADLSVTEYARQIADAVTTDELSRAIDVRRWAQEGFAMRSAVYDFDLRSRLLPAAYLERMELITRERLALAAARLAMTLNEIFCE